MVVLVTGCTWLLLLLRLVLTAGSCQSGCFTFFGVRAIRSIGYYLLFLLLLLLELLDGRDCII